MVYCRLLSKKADSAIYSYGSLPDALTGKVEFYSDETVMPRIIDKPINSDVPLRFLLAAYRKHLNDFKESVFPEKLSYEF